MVLEGVVGQFFGSKLQKTRAEAECLSYKVFHSCSVRVTEAANHYVNGEQ